MALIGAGVPLDECLAAAEQLAEVGIAARVIDLHSIKPLDRAMLIETCRATEGRLVVVEDHCPQGGIRGEVMEALADAELDELHVTLLGVNGLPMSGQPAELLDAAGIFARHIVAAIRKLMEVREWTPTIRPTNPIDEPARQPRLMLASALMFVADLDRSVVLHQDFLGLEAIIRSDEATFLLSPGGYQLYLRSIGKRAQRFTGSIGIQYLVWTAEDSGGLRRPCLAPRPGYSSPGTALVTIAVIPQRLPAN